MLSNFKRHDTEFSIYDLLTAEPSFTNILQYVTLTLDIYQVRHSVGRCVKIRVVIIKHGNG